MTSDRFDGNAATRTTSSLHPKLISQFQGSLKDDFRNAVTDIKHFATDDGVEKLITYLKERLHITDYSYEVKAFEGYFKRPDRRNGDSMTKFKNDEETTYRRLQSVLNEAMRNGEDEYSDDDGTVTTKNGKLAPKFRLPKRLRG